MKTTFTLFGTTRLKAIAAALLVMIAGTTYSQISLVCTSPTNTIYGLTGNGEIYAINTGTAKTGTVVKNNSYLGNGPSSSNGMGYNTFNGMFYYFKRNVTDAPQEFVSFSPTTGLVVKLANSTCTDDVHTGCVSYNGTGYYTVDIDGKLHYYNIASNTWKQITTKIVDQNGNNVTTIIQTQNAGDMAIDGNGNIWLLTSSSSNWGLYKIPAPMPTTPVAQLNVIRVIDPTRATPTGESFAGVAFGTSGQMFLATKNDNRLYRLTNTSTLAFIGILDKSDVGNDLTSCSFPNAVLPISWKSFDVTLQNYNTVMLNWEVTEANNKGFYVQHSTNGNDWEQIGFVAANSPEQSTQKYAYSHNNKMNGKHYYRLKQVDLDGQESYSETRVVTINNEKQIVSVWPNPATNEVRITASGNNFLTKAQVFDLSGRMVAEKKLQGNGNSIAVSQLPTGTYIVRVESNTGLVYNEKISKQ